MNAPTPANSQVRASRLAGLRSRIADLRAQFRKAMQDVAATVKKVAKRRDDRLAQKTRDELFS
jgi:hypothetical protein